MYVLKKSESIDNFLLLRLFGAFFMPGRYGLM